MDTDLPSEYIESPWGKSKIYDPESHPTVKKDLLNRNIGYK